MAADQAAASGIATTTSAIAMAERNLRAGPFPTPMVAVPGELGISVSGLEREGEIVSRLEPVLR